MKTSVRSRLRQAAEIGRSLLKPESSETSDELKRITKLPRGHLAETDLLGKPLTLYCPRVFPDLFQEIWERGIYEFSSNRLDPFIIDAGANIGLATLAFKRQYPNARVIAIEAMPEIASVLNKNITSFGYDDVIVINKAISGKSGFSRFASEPNGTAGRLHAGGAMTVELVQLSELIGDNHVDFLKIDIEGAEYDVLAEVEPQLGQVDRLFLELHGHVGEPQRHHEALTILNRAGFRVQLESGGPKASRPFIRCSEHKGMDLLLNVYATRTACRKVDRPSTGTESDS